MKEKERIKKFIHYKKFFLNKLQQQVFYMENNSLKLISIFLSDGGGENGVMNDKLSG